MTKEMIAVIRQSQSKVGSKWVSDMEPIEDKISLQQFIDSYVNERWRNERRYNKEHTKLGYYHTKTIVKFDEHSRVVRSFIFPE